jgi:hypothetical protein
VPYCPACREEYREGFTVCADCGAGLVETLPAEGDLPAETEGGSHGGWDQVAESGQVYEAELMAMRLRAAGIEAEVVDQTFRQEPMPDVRSFAVVRVLVPVAQASEARRILAEGDPLPEDAEVEPEPTSPDPGEK